jgi:competence protein ComGC
VAFPLRTKPERMLRLIIAPGYPLKGEPMMSISARGHKARHTAAFSLAELLVVVACTIVVAVVLLPSLARSKARSSRINCANQMKQIGLAFRTFSLDNDDLFPMQVSVTNGGTMELVASGVVYPHFEVMSNELSTPKILLCPHDEKRSCATNFAVGLRETNLSYFVNVDARDGDVSRILCGDRNITNRARPGSRLVSLTKADTVAWTKEMHREKGNLGFGDGRVSLFNNGSVGGAYKIGDGATNWLAVP